MKLVLHYEKTIGEIKREFSHTFPYLRIEFFQKNNEGYNWFNQQNKLSDNTSIGDIQGVLKEGVVDITPDKTVKEVEQIFENRFSLPVHLYYRRAKGLWTETTDHHLTLQKQNEIARSLAPLPRF